MVNTASRLKSQGAPGRTHVSETVFERLQGRFAFEAQGTIELKGRPPMNTRRHEKQIGYDRLRGGGAGLTQTGNETCSQPMVPRKRFSTSTSFSTLMRVEIGV